MKIHKSSQRKRARTYTHTLEKSKKMQKGEKLKRMHFMFNVHVFFICISFFYICTVHCEARITIFMRWIIYFSCFLFSHTHTHTYKCMPNERTNEWNQNGIRIRETREKNGKTQFYILFLKSNQYSVVTRMPKLTIHVSFYNSYYVSRRPCKINSMENTQTHTHQHNKMFGRRRRFFLFHFTIARITKVGKNSSFCVFVYNLLVSSVIRQSTFPSVSNERY